MFRKEGFPAQFVATKDQLICPVVDSEPKLVSKCRVELIRGIEPTS